MNRNVPEPGNPVIVVTGTGKRSGNRIRENRHGNDERKEQGHGAGTWHRCRGDMQGSAAARRDGRRHVDGRAGIPLLPRAAAPEENGLPENGLRRGRANRADPGTARPAGHLLPMRIPADRTREKKPRGCGGRGLHRRLVRPPGSGNGEYGSRENGDPAARGLRVPVLPHARPHDARRHEDGARMGRPRRQGGPRTTHVHLGRDRLRGGTDRSLESGT
ncbi:hypothetical protein HMPREF0175_0517 [Bifidobacterium longum subsp. longum ATCC 55813]|nr:hypothetical protein HMPREF0175_0517 [Bifidobacterium longum subsp. longum ATCC 55813]